MARDYWFGFGSTPQTSTGLNPTFIRFVNGSGQTLTPPTITETYTGSGMYRSNYNPTQTVAFILDGATTGLSDSIRYILGVMDPQDQFGSTLTGIGVNTITLLAIGTTGLQQSVNIGTTLVGIGNTLLSIDVSAINNIGNTASPFGDQTTDPVTVFGYLKRLREFLEGNQTYTKANGSLVFSARGGNTLLASKSVSDSNTSTNKT